jgi:hypothetical protein
MLLCDHIVFWERNKARPVFDDGELETYIERITNWTKNRLTTLCKSATARMIQNMRKT